MTGAFIKIWIEFLTSKPGTWRLHVDVSYGNVSVLWSSKLIVILARCSNLASKRLKPHNSIPSPFYAVTMGKRFARSVRIFMHLYAFQRDRKFSSFLAHGMTSFVLAWTWRIGGKGVRLVIKSQVFHCAIRFHIHFYSSKVARYFEGSGLGSRWRHQNADMFPTPRA